MATRDEPVTPPGAGVGDVGHVHDAFISYSHAADGRLAPALQDGLQRFAKRWTARRALRVFRDDTGLAVSSALWPSIRRALDGSTWFVLLASPTASSSEWVDREVARWLELGRRDRILPVLTDGTWEWDDGAGDFAAGRSSAVPPSLRGAFEHEPRHLDLRWARDPESSERLHLGDPQFRRAVAEIAAPIHGRPRDELEGRDLDEHRRARRARRIATSALAVLAAGLAVAAALAVANAREAGRQEQEALAQARRATSGQLAAQSVALAESDLDRALLLGLAARSIDDRPEVAGALLTALEANPVLVGHIHAGDGGVTALAAADGSLLAVGESSGLVRLVDVDTLTEVARARLADDPVTSLAVADDATIVAAGTETGEVVTWRRGDDAIDRLGGTAIRAPVTALGLGTRRDRVAAAWDRPTDAPDDQESVAAWRLESTGEPWLPPVPGPIGIEQVGFLDDRRLSIVGYFDAWLLDPETGEVLVERPLMTGGVQPGPSAHTLDLGVGAFSQFDLGVVSTYVPDPSGRPFDGTDLGGIDLGGGALDTMRWDPDGEVLAIAKEETVHLVDREGSRLALLPGAEAGIRDIAFPGTGDRLATLGSGVVQVWEPGAGSRLRRQPPVEPVEVPNVVKNVVDVDVADDGRRMAWIADPGGTFRGGEALFPAGEQVTVWDRASGTVTTTAATPGAVCRVVLGDEVVTTSDCADGGAGTVRSWRLDPAGPTDAPDCLQGGTGSLHRQPTLVLRRGRPSPSVRVCAAGSWRRVALAPLAPVLDVDTASLGVTTSSDGSTLAAVDPDGTVGVLSLDDPDRQPVAIETGLDTSGPSGIALSPDGSVVMVASSEDATEGGGQRTTVTLHDATGDGRVATIGAAAIDDVALSAGGDLVAVAQSGGAIELLDGRTTQLLTTLPGNGDGRARVVEFSDDGTTLVEATSGGGLTAWEIDVDRWTRRACTIAGRSLTAEERRTFLGDLASTPGPCASMDTTVPTPSGMPGGSASSTG